MSDTKPDTKEDNSVVESEVVATLRQASDGLLFISETDAPLVPFFWPDENNGAEMTPERLRELANVPEDAPIKSSSIATFFKPATKAEDWHNDDEKAEVARFQALVETLKSTLKKPMAWRVGETEIAVYVVGAVSDGWAGVQTRVVET